MTPTIRCAQIALAVSVAVAALPHEPVAAGERAAPVARYTANALNMASDEGPAATLVEIDIDRWSTEDEHNRLAMPLASNGQSAASTILRNMPRIGVLRTLSPPGEPLYYAHRTVRPDGTQRILLIASRPIRAFERSMKPNMSAFPFSVIELNIDASGQGNGTLHLAATLKGEPEKAITPEPDRFILPVRLTKVRPVK